jgi:hypothetical protein
VDRGHLGPNHSDGTAGKGQSGQVSLTGHPRWVSLDRTERTGLPGHDSGIKRTVDKGVWAEQLEQDSWDKAAHSWDRTAGIGQLGQDRRDKTAGTEQPGQESRSTGTGKSERQAG